VLVDAQPANATVNANAMTMAISGRVSERLERSMVAVLQTIGVPS
jgi:hypothetical protein